MAWHPLWRGARKVVDVLNRRERGRGAGRRAPAGRWALEGLDLFATVPRAELQQLVPALRIDRLEPRAPVVCDDDGVRVVAAGGIKLARVSALGRRLIVGLLGPGDVFGRVSADNVDDSYVLEAVEASEVVVIARTAFEALLERKQFAFRVVQLLEERERQLERRVESLVFKDVRTRLIETLLALATEQGQACEHGMAVDVRITQQDLADLIGASRQMVNRILGELSRSLHVRRMGKVLCILNKERLERLVDQVSTG